MKKDIEKFVWLGLCAAVFVVFLVQGLYIEPEGDDLDYGAYFNYYGGSLLYYPRWVLRHWALTNGRFSCYLAPLALWLAPRWFATIINSVVVALFFYFSGRCLGNRASLARIMLGSLMLLTMAWWDASTLIDVSLNYVWAAAAGVAFVYLWLIKPWRKRERVEQTLLCVFAFIAGQMHEAMALPLSAGLLVYCLMDGRWKRMERSRLVCLLWFWAGALLCFASPGLWRRVGMAHEPDDTLGVLLLKSDFYVPVMLAAIAAAAVFCRQKVRELVRSPWLVLAIAAVGSMCISGVGGIVGRSGWFAQTYALIVLLWMFWPDKESRALSVATYGMAAAALVIWSMMTGVQWRLGQEARIAAALYHRSPSGTFYMDHTSVEALPWYALGRPRGAVSNSDDNSRHILEREYRPGCDYAMLPAWAEGMAVDSLLSRPASEFSLTPRAQCVLPTEPYHGFWRDGEGKAYVEVRAVHHGVRLYYSEPLEAAPGYRLPKW